MKTITSTVMTLLTCGTISAQDGWKLAHRDDGLAYLNYSWDAKSEASPSIKGLAEIIAARDKSIPLKHLTFHSYFNYDPIIQRELLAEFRSSYPELLDDALKSSGNMHNPKVLPLRSKFSECLLRTPTLTRINEVLSLQGYSATEAGFEKFSISKDRESRIFHAAIWLTLEPTTKEIKKQNKPEMATPRNPSD